MFKSLLPKFQQRVDTALEHHLPRETLHPRRLHEAMRYVVFNGGKRVRPVLVYASAAALGGELDHADDAACAVELIHAYSLVHDDLPAMDDDDLRRGKPTCHRAYDEATAILVGDALQTLAFRILAIPNGGAADAAVKRLHMIESLALASGSRGMVGGQAIDLEAVGRVLNIAELEDMHIHKTGALIRAAVKLGALSVAQAQDERIKCLDRYAQCIGLAFQIRDDILDIEASTAVLGKTKGADLARNKPTYPSLLGLDGAKQRAEALHEEAVAHLAPFDSNADPLRWLSDYIVKRGS